MPHSCLIVDDSTVIRNVADRILTTLGMEVRQAETGMEALAQCKQALPDAIVVDWDLPSEDSVELIREMRMHGSDTKRPKIIYLTSEQDIGSMPRAKRAGADAFFMKPFDRSQMHAKFRELGLVA